MHLNFQGFKPAGSRRNKILVIAVLISLVLAGFASFVHAETNFVSTEWNKGFSYPQGVAVDSSGNVYVTENSNTRVLKFSSSGVLLAKFGMLGSGNGQFLNPEGIAVDSSGNVYVADSGNNRVVKFSSSGAFLANLGSPGSADGQFNGVGGVAVDNLGNVYVGDSHNYRIQKFSSSGVFLTKWGSAGSGNGQFNTTVGIAVDGSGNVYAADSYNYRVQKFTNSGVFLANLGSPGSADGQYNRFSSVAVDSSGNVYISDYMSVQKFSSSGAFIANLGTFGSKEGQLSYVVGVAVDGSGNVYAADYGNDWVSKFSNTGTFLANLGTKGSGDGQFNTPEGVAVDGSGNVYIADTNNNRIQKFSASGVFLAKWGTYGSGDSQFTYPFGVAVDGSGNVYVADSYNNRIQKFSDSGVFLAKWGSAGSGEGQFNHPDDVAVDGSGNVYVTDSDNCRVEKFNSSGAFLTQWGTKGSGDGQLIWPYCIAVDGSGNVYVSDYGNNRVVKFSSSGAFLANLGTKGYGDGQFTSPLGVAVDDSGNLYVVDIFRVQKLSSSGAFLASWGSYGSGDGQLTSPWGVDVDASGNVYVIDSKNCHIQQFSITLASFVISVNQGTNGVISPGTSTAQSDSNPTYTITPNTGYHVADVTVDGASVGAVTSYTFSNLKSAHSITASFAVGSASSTSPTATPSSSVIPGSTPKPNFSSLFLWAPPSVANAAAATIISAIVMGITAVMASAAGNPVGTRVSKLSPKIRELLNSSVKRWLEDFVNSKRKLTVSPKASSRFIPTKSEAITYVISIVVLTLSFSYVRVNNLIDLLQVIPMILATSVFVKLAKSFILIIFSRTRGVWTEIKFWYLGLGIFLVSTLAFRIPFSSPTRFVHHTSNYTKRLGATLSGLSISIDLGFAAVFGFLFLGGLTLIGSTGIAICLISAFLDSYPLSPMSGKDIFDHNKLLWLAFFVPTLTLYCIWLILF